MKLQDYYQQFEDALLKLGVPAEQARCEEPGQWVLFRDNTEIYVDIWQPDTMTEFNYYEAEEPPVIFQVLSPVVALPDRSRQDEFYSELLQMNFNMFFGSFFINLAENVAAVKYRRVALAITESEMIESIESVGYYSGLFSEGLEAKYNIPTIKQPQV